MNTSTLSLSFPAMETAAMFSTLPGFCPVTYPTHSTTFITPRMMRQWPGKVQM